jgi:hypothetical protein
MKLGDDIIDSRDVIERINELKDILSDRVFTEIEQTEWFNLRDLGSQAWDVSEEWDDGEALIHDTYFADYARELVQDCGYFDGPGVGGSIDFDQWPYRCIDWDQVAEELQGDYTPVEVAGHTYWVRAS